MASADGKTAHILEFYEKLQSAPYKFDFLAALRRLECLHRDKPKIGESSLPREDAVRFVQEPSLRFEPSSLAGLEYGKGKSPPKLSVTLLGLFGPNGPLPLHMTDYARQRLRAAKDPTFSRFADIFHHRMISLLYRAWANSEPTVSYDRPDSDRFGDMLASLMGLGIPELQDRDAMPDLAKRHFTGRLAQQTRNREGLEAILRNFFDIEVEIEQFVGHWMRLPETCRWRLGADPSTGVLGQSVVAGASVWDRQSKFRIILGPLDQADFQRFLPKGSSLKRLVAIVRNYAGDEWLWDVNLLLKRDEVPKFELGKSGQLGWNTWCASQRLDRPADDLCLAPERHGEFEKVEKS